MKSRDFCYWLQGFFELVEADSLTPKQIQIIRNHLNMVFRHEIDPSFGGPKEQEDLEVLHSGVQGTPYRPSNGPLMKC